MFFNKGKRVKSNLVSSEEKNISLNSSSLVSNQKLYSLDKDENIYEYISNMNKINYTIEFLVKINSEQLMKELYSLMESQICIYRDIKMSRILELTVEQFDILKKYNVELEYFKSEPFLIDSITIYEKVRLNYKYYDSESEIDSFLEEYDKKQEGARGLYFITSNLKGILGSGIYVCDMYNINSEYLFNNFIQDRVDILSRSSKYIYYLEGEYSGIVKRCIFGELQNMCILLEPLKEYPLKNKERLSSYGLIDTGSQDAVRVSDEFGLKLQESILNIDTKLSIYDDKSEEVFG